MLSRKESEAFQYLEKLYFHGKDHFESRDLIGKFDKRESSILFYKLCKKDYIIKIEKATPGNHHKYRLSTAAALGARGDNYYWPASGLGHH